MLGGREFFKKAFDEEFKPDVEQVVDTPVEGEDTQVEETSTEVTEEVTESPETVSTFNIDGEEYTLDQIKEWKQNGLRQSDYTRKTQELAEQRKQLGQVEIPTDINTDSERIARIERELAVKELDLEITTLKQKYPDFDEIKVLGEAEKRGILDDLEFVYKATRDVASAPVDLEAVKAQSIAEYKAQIETEKQINKESTDGSIISSAPGQPVIEYGDELSSAEKQFCNKRGWTYKKYVEMKNQNY